jgi:hypothetical protein
MKSKRAQGFVFGCVLLLTLACGKSMDQLKAALGKIDLGKLDGMKMQGVQQ